MKNEFGNSVSESEHRLRQWIGSIQARSGDLAASEAKVVDLLLTDPLFFGASTTAEVAARAGVSPPTVIRAARALGFSGFYRAEDRDRACSRHSPVLRAS
ncbi:MurR/RpiR family transcriptional regulator [Burkholderia cenocepacia]|uniref:MurR/RpiR family transcriptional regulator n=1 Tax=Burkholderia cenocepacia TaxID=95486 RepID=UPI0020121C7B|nr:hypothetical protein [Burkholderia cenocepacia]